MRHNSLGLFIAAVYALSAGCSGAGGAAGGIDFTQIHQPDWYAWYYLASVAAFLYVPLAPLLAIGAADIRLVAALPLTAGTALATFGLQGTGSPERNDPSVRSRSGRGCPGGKPVSVGRRRRCVGGHEFRDWRDRQEADSRPGTTPSGSIALVFSAAATLCAAGLMVYVWTTVGKDAALSASTAWILFVISLATLIAASVSAFWPQRRMTRPASSGWLWLFAVLTTVAAGLVFLASRKLTAIAAARG